VDHDDKLNDLLRLIGQQQVGNRAGRIEPRALKRRKKSYDLLTKTRHRARAYLLRHGHPQNVK